MRLTHSAFRRRATQIKGLEFDIVVIYKFSRQYFDVFDPNAVFQDKCPSGIWVGAPWSVLFVGAAATGISSASSLLADWPAEPMRLDVRPAQVSCRCFRWRLGAF